MLIEACVSPPPSFGGGGSGDASLARNVGEGGADTAAATTDTAGDDPNSGVSSGTTGVKKERGSQARGDAAPGAVTFGGFASGSAWKNMGRAFAGDGSSFLFTFDGGVPRSAGEEPQLEGGGNSGGGGGGSDGGLAGDEAGLRVYPWARADRCFMTSDDGVGLGMGGGGNGGNFGFLLSADLRRGSTGPCETFRNLPLVVEAGLSGGIGGSVVIGEGKGTLFDVLSLEVWGFRAAKAPDGLTRIAL